MTYVVARRTALARAMAIFQANYNGLHWETMAQSRRDKLVKDFEAIVDSWVANKVLATFVDEYRE